MAIQRTSINPRPNVQTLNEETGSDEQTIPADAKDKEIQELREKLAKAEARLTSSGVSPEIEELVRIKMRAGLSRDDALVCARRQVAHDKVIAEEAKLGKLAKDASEEEISKNAEAKTKIGLDKIHAGQLN